MKFVAACPTASCRKLNIYISEGSYQSFLHCDCIVPCITLAERDPVHCHFADAVEMYESCYNHQDVEYLM